MYSKGKKSYSIFFFIVIFFAFSCTNPDACFTCSNYDVYEYDTIKIENCSDNYSTLFWDFGNGTTSSEVNPQISYITDSINTVEYNINLSISSGEETDEETQKVLIRPAFQKIIGNYLGTRTTDTVENNHLIWVIYQSWDTMIVVTKLAQSVAYAHLISNNKLSFDSTKYTQKYTGSGTLFNDTLEIFLTDTVSNYSFHYKGTR